MKPANHLKFLNVFLHQINPWMTLCIYFSKTYVTPIIDPVNVDVKQKQINKMLKPLNKKY